MHAAHGANTSVGHVRYALRPRVGAGRDADDLLAAIEGFTAERMALPR